MPERERTCDRLRGSYAHWGQKGGKRMPKKVMIVEDNELNMKLFRDLIEAMATKPCARATVSRRSISPASTVPT